MAVEALEDGTILGVFGRPLKPQDNGHGYLTVKVNQKHTYVHHLVCEKFHGPRPEGMEVAHIDGNTLNNAASNLRWSTPKDNHADKKLHGTDDRGTKNSRAAFSDEQVKHIRHLYAIGYSQYYLAEEYNVSQATISRVVTGVRYGT